MEVVTAWLNILKQWVAYGSSCLELPIQAPVCKPFWTWAMIGAFAFGGLVVLVVVWKIVSYRIKLAAALKAEEQRARVDHEAIAAKRWDDDKAYSTELGGEEIERRIREAVDQRRAESPPFPNLVLPKRREQ